MKYILMSTILFFLSTCDYCEFIGAKDLGQGLVLLEGDRIEDRVIIKCSAKSKGCCRAGSFILPTYKEHYTEDGEYSQYILSAKSDDKWLIAKSKYINEDTEKYWILNKSLIPSDCLDTSCDSLIRSIFIGPLEFSDFEEELKVKNIVIALD